MMAATRRHCSVVEVLISFEASPNKKNKKGCTALHYACKNGALDIVKMLILKGADIEAEEEGGLTPLMMAATRRHCSVVEVLISSEASPNIKNKKGCTALHNACENGALDIVKMLILKGAIIETEDRNGSTPLMMAARKGHHSVVKKLVSSGASLNINKKNEEGHTALDYACENGDLDIVKVLISYSADIETEDHDGSTPLRMAAVRRHSSVVGVLISSGASLNKKNKQGRTALHYACENGGLGIVNMLIYYNRADIETEDHDGFTPLMVAVMRRHCSVVEVLISSGASLNKKSKEGRTALQYTCENGDLDIVKMLISRGADIETEDRDGSIPLMMAARKRHHSVVNKLVSSGASLNKGNMKGRTALHYACENGGLDIVNMLIYNRADIETEDHDGFTPLMMAARKRHHSVVNKLVSSGAALNKKNKEGHTALDYACENGDLDVVNMLISNKADIETEDHDGSTPLMMAAMRRHSSVVEVLISSGASLNKKNKEGRTALYYAAEAINVKCCRLLIEAGADISIISKEAQAALMYHAVKKGLDSQLKTIMPAGVTVNHKDECGQTALHYAAEHNHIQCGILLAEGGADIRIRDDSGRTPMDYASTEFKAAVEHTLLFHSEKTICVIGNASSGKSTLIASLQNENAPFIKKISNRIFGVKNIHQRTAGIEPVSLSSKRCGNVTMFDFAGQHEYHGPHEMFLESILTKTGSTVTIILVVKVTEEESVISQQLYRWLTLISKMCSSSSPVRVIVVGSFLDKAKSKTQAKDKLSHCYQRIQEDLKDAAMEFQGPCFLNCRQPYSDGIDQLFQWLDEVPTPLYKAADTQYSISWVISRINHTFVQKAIKLIDLTKWINDNKANLPTNLPSAEVVCSDLSATGHFLYLPNKVDSSKSWLILDLAAILHDVYGRIFSPFNKFVDQYGLLKCLDLQQLFSTLDEDMIHNVLIALEFCIEVDPTLLSEEIMKLKGSEKDDFLFFPALVSANPPEEFPSLHPGAEVHTLCWQLKADEKHFISPRLMQTTILRLAAHQVFHHQLGWNTKEHCCSVWWNGISWQFPDGVDVAVQISDNALVQVLGRSKAGADVLCKYISEITFDIVTTILQLFPDFSANSYIIRSLDPIKLLKEHEYISSESIFPISSVLSIMMDGREFCFSRPDQSGKPVSLPVSDLFSGAHPSLDTVQKLCFPHPVCGGEALHIVLVIIPFPTHYM